MNATFSQALRFLVVGGSLLVLDTALYAAGTLLGLPNGLANPLSRATAAIVGYFGHRHLTFATSNRAIAQPVERLRYATVWLCLTLISTQTLAAIASHADSVAAMAAKPFVEAVLALISFSLLKLWVYRQ